MNQMLRAVRPSTAVASRVRAGTLVRPALARGARAGSTGGRRAGHWEQRETRVKEALPPLPNRRPYIIAGVLATVASWYAFSMFLNNKERLSSSVLRMVMNRIKDSPAGVEQLGRPVSLKGSILGDPWIEGMVNPVRGKVDLSFEIEGPRGRATVYFTSVRQQHGQMFEVLRFLVVPSGDASHALSLLSPGTEHSLNDE